MTQQLKVFAVLPEDLFGFQHCHKGGSQSLVTLAIGNPTPLAPIATVYMWLTQTLTHKYKQNKI